MKPKTTRKASTHETLNWWKVTATIVVVGALCWTALLLFSGCVSFKASKAPDGTEAVSYQKIGTGDLLEMRATNLPSVKFRRDRR